MTYQIKVYSNPITAKVYPQSAAHEVILTDDILHELAASWIVSADRTHFIINCLTEHHFDKLVQRCTDLIGGFAVSRVVHIPAPVQKFAAAIAEKYSAELNHIEFLNDSEYKAHYTDLTLKPNTDGYFVYRTLSYVCGTVKDITTA